MLFVRFLQLLPPAPPQSLCRFANAAYPRDGTETRIARMAFMTDSKCGLSPRWDGNLFSLLGIAIIGLDAFLMVSGLIDPAEAAVKTFHIFAIVLLGGFSVSAYCRPSSTKKYLNASRQSAEPFRKPSRHEPVGYGYAADRRLTFVLPSRQPDKTILRGVDHHGVKNDFNYLRRKRKTRRRTGHPIL